MARRQTGSRNAGGIRERNGAFEVRWRDGEGKRKSRTFARKADAELELRRALTLAEEQRRGIQRLAPPARTLGELVDAWLAAKARKRSLEDDRSILRAHLVPFFGIERRLVAITFGEVERFKSSRGKLHPNTVNHHLSLLGSMLRFAVRLGWIDRAPEVKKHRVELVSERFRYLKNELEVRRFLSAARAESEDVFELYAAAILTGARAGELAGLRWEDVDLTRGVLHIHRSFHGPTKSGKARHVVILDALLPILRARRLRVGGVGHVFLSRAGTPFLPSSSVFQEVLHRVLARAGFEAGYIVFHSLRHTFASHVMMDGGDLFRLQKLLGHQSAAMTQRYAHLSPSAFEADRTRLAGLVPELGGSVVPIAAAGVG